MCIYIYIYIYTVISAARSSCLSPAGSALARTLPSLGSGNTYIYICIYIQLVYNNKLIISFIIEDDTTKLYHPQGRRSPGRSRP